MNKKNIVTIGGGTGSFVLLSGLKKYNDVKLTAIVSMADDGGSTGVLRDEVGVLPPGDVRQCLAALSDATPALRSLFSYRFSDGGLSGHNFGNLLISALEKTTGSFSSAVEEASKIFSIKGLVLPVSEEDMRLVVTLKNGKILYGEDSLDDNEDVRSIGVRSVSLANQVNANKRAVEAILSADVVVVGPGDLYGSIAPNLLVSGIPEALNESKAKVVYVANLTNKKGQTDNFTAHDYADKIYEYIGSNRIDIILANSGIPNSNLLEKYSEQEGDGTLVENKKCGYKDCKVCLANIVSASEPEKVEGDSIASTRSFIRHDSDELAREIMNIVDGL